LRGVCITVHYKQGEHRVRYIKRKEQNKTSLSTSRRRYRKRSRRQAFPTVSAIFLCPIPQRALRSMKVLIPTLCSAISKTYLEQSHPFEGDYHHREGKFLSSYTRQQWSGVSSHVFVDEGQARVRHLAIHFLLRVRRGRGIEGLRSSSPPATRSRHRPASSYLISEF